MYEFALVLLFTAAGGGAALLAWRAASSSPGVRWLTLAFVALLAGNLGLYVWPAIAADPAAAARRTGIAALVALAVWAYARLVRTARRAAARGHDEP